MKQRRGRFAVAGCGLMTVLLATLVGCKASATKCVSDVTQLEKANGYQCIYEGEAHEFFAFFPEEREEKCPLIVMLPGYGNNAEAFRNMTKMDCDANARGYAVVYVTATPDKEKTAAGFGWNSGLDDCKKDDVGFLKALVHYLQEEKNCDKDKTFVAGFSNGAFMTQRLAMEASDTFRAVASVAGMMPQKIWENKKDSASVGVLEIYGTRDEVVPMHANGSADYAIAPAIEDVMDYWVKANGLTLQKEEALSNRATCSKYTNEKNKEFVWQVIIEGGGHSWPDERLTGVDANQVILDFFEQYSE